MSADRWAVCPKCKEKVEQAHANLLSRVETDYGKVAANEYIELIEQSRQSDEEERTLREDWEIGIWDGELIISYRASCEECGFTYEFEHKKKV